LETLAGRDQPAAVQDAQGLLHGALRQTGFAGDVAMAESHA